MVLNSGHKSFSNSIFKDSLLYLNDCFQFPKTRCVTSPATIFNIYLWGSHDCYFNPDIFQKPSFWFIHFQNSMQSNFYLFVLFCFLSLCVHCESQSKHIGTERLGPYSQNLSKHICGDLISESEKWKAIKFLLVTNDLYFLRVDVLCKVILISKNVPRQIFKLFPANI